MAHRTLDQILDNHVVKLSGTDGENTKDKLVGAAFIVVSKDEVIYRGGAGYGFLSEEKTPPKFSTDSFTWVASLTKIFTITCLMQLVERGLITLDDDDLRTIVPELGQMQILKGFQESNASKSDASDSSPEQPILVDNTKPITLRHLLTHTVGLGYDIADPDLRRWTKAIGRTITNLSFTLDGWNTPLKFPPGEGWFYGSAIDWAGQVLEKVTGQTLSEYMAEHIFQPLGIHETTFRPDTFLESVSGPLSRAVSCSFRDPGKGTVSMIPLPVPEDPSVDSGGAGLWTTAEDYAKMLQNVLKSKLGDPRGLLSNESADEMFRPQLNEVQHSMLKSLTDTFHDDMVPEFPFGTPINHGLGGVINTEDVPGKRRKGSMMWEGMANAHWWIDPETGIAAALLVNILWNADPVAISLYNDLELAVYAELVPEWLAKKDS